MLRSFFLWISTVFLLTFCFPVQAQPAPCVHLTIAEKTVHLSGQEVGALAVNNKIPGPTLHFKEGDTVCIDVTNHLSDRSTVLHWHGVLVPWQMDGVSRLTQEAIAPNQTFHYEFKLLQSGTYWYHAHEEMQESEGLYGAIIIDPKESPQYHYDSSEDYPIVLSSLQGIPLFNGMSSMDSWNVSIHPGTIARLRFINADAMNNFKVSIPNATMMVINLDGNDVVPFEAKEFVIAPGETYDVLVAPISHVSEQNYRVLAESRGPFSFVKSSSQSNELTQGTVYDSIKAAVPTNDPTVPIANTFKMDLNMMSINNISETAAGLIMLEPGKRYRFIFTNHSGMNHPMHMHGHWFILRNGHGAYDPLLHTINVPTGATVVADMDADMSGQWLFHCHNLQHMMMGMAREFRYTTLVPISKGLEKAENEIEALPFKNQAIVRKDVLPIDQQLIDHPSPHGEHH